MLQEAQVTVECVIPQQYHRTVMGRNGTNVQEITKNHEVGIKFPDRPVQDSQSNGNIVNGVEEEGEAGEKSPKKGDIIVITGKPENCQAAKEALLVRCSFIFL